MLRLGLILLLLCGAARSEESSPGPREHAAQKPESHDSDSHALERNPVPFPFWFQDKPVPPTVNVYTGKHADDHDECSAPKDWKEWAGFSFCKASGWLDAERVIALFTVILGIATWLLWQATDKLVKGAERTAERQLRAYVFVEAKSIFFLYDGDSCRITLTYSVKNFGQTPAYQVLQWGEVRNLMVPTTEKIETPDPLAGPLSPVDLGPGASIEGTVWGIMQVSFLKTLATSFKKIHVVGAVVYIDAFEKRRETKFCFFVENLQEIVAGHTGRSGDNPGGTKFWHSPQHNTAT